MQRNNIESLLLCAIVHSQNIFRFIFNWMLKYKFKIVYFFTISFVCIIFHIQ